MVGTSILSMGAGPSYTNALLGQSPSGLERDQVRKKSFNILRQDDIVIEKSDAASPPESCSLHYDRTDQAPYSLDGEARMSVEGTSSHGTHKFDSEKLIEFLRTTGPKAAHRRPRRLKQVEGDLSARKRALRFFGLTQRKAEEAPDFRDEGGLLKRRAYPAPIIPLPNQVKQKVSLEGRRYLALEIDDSPKPSSGTRPEAMRSPSIMDSIVSVKICDEEEETDSKDERHSLRRKKAFRRPTPVPLLDQNNECNEELDHEHEDREKPIRPAASNPPTPEPWSAISTTSSYQDGAVQAASREAPVNGHTIPSKLMRVSTSASLPILGLLAPSHQTESGHLPDRQSMEIKQPFPRRLASHPVLLQRASSLMTMLTPRSASDSPGPPPRSPLRLQREKRNTGNPLEPSLERKVTPRMAPSIRTASDFGDIMMPSVVTDCTGPIKRPKSRARTNRTPIGLTTPRKERGEQVFTRKVRDRPVATRAIDAVVNIPAESAKQRLKKARPRIQIPDIRPTALARRTSSSNASNASWTKPTADPFTSAGANDNEVSPISPINSDHTSFTQVSPAVSRVSTVEQMAFSSVMLVAEEVPRITAKSPPRPSRRSNTPEVRSYAARPRSASVPKRRSRQGTRTPTRPRTPSQAPQEIVVPPMPSDRPNRTVQGTTFPPLPSPPPDRALPLLPFNGAHRRFVEERYVASLDEQVDSPMLFPQQQASLPFNRPQLDYERQPMSTNNKPVPQSVPARKPVPPANNTQPFGKPPHVVTQTQRRRRAQATPQTPTEIHARLEALEINNALLAKNNTLLSARIEAILQTQGDNGGFTASAVPVNGVQDLGMPVNVTQIRRPMIWASRVAKRTATNDTIRQIGTSQAELNGITGSGAAF